MRMSVPLTGEDSDCQNCSTFIKPEHSVQLFIVSQKGYYFCLCQSLKGHFMHFFVCQHCQSLKLYHLRPAYWEEKILCSMYLNSLIKEELPVKQLNISKKIGYQTVHHCLYLHRHHTQNSRMLELCLLRKGYTVVIIWIIWRNPTGGGRSMEGEIPVPMEPYHENNSNNITEKIKKSKNKPFVHFLFQRKSLWRLKRSVLLLNNIDECIQFKTQLAVVYLDKFEFWANLTLPPFDQFLPSLFFFMPQALCGKEKVLRSLTYSFYSSDLGTEIHVGNHCGCIMVVVVENKC